MFTAIANHLLQSTAFNASPAARNWMDGNFLLIQRNWGETTGFGVRLFA